MKWHDIKKQLPPFDKEVIIQVEGNFIFWAVLRMIPVTFILYFELPYNEGKIISIGKVIKWTIRIK